MELCTCACSCAGMLMQVYMSMCMHLCSGQSSMLGVFLSCSPSFKGFYIYLLYAAHTYTPLSHLTGSLPYLGWDLSLELIRPARVAASPMQPSISLSVRVCPCSAAEDTHVCLRTWSVCFVFCRCWDQTQVLALAVSTLWTEPAPKPHFGLNFGLLFSLNFSRK